MAKSPDIARFGAALPPGAEELRADAAVATYRVRARLDDLWSLYRGLYGKTTGVQVERIDQPTPAVAVVVGRRAQDVDFGLLLARHSGERDAPLAHDILVFARGADPPAGYPDSSPWLQRRPKG